MLRIMMKMMLKRLVLLQKVIILESEMKIALGISTGLTMEVSHLSG